jgi:hypothetical protein
MLPTWHAPFLLGVLSLLTGALILSPYLAGKQRVRGQAQALRGHDGQGDLSECRARLRVRGLRKGGHVVGSPNEHPGSQDWTCLFMI